MSDFAEKVKTVTIDISDAASNPTTCDTNTLGDALNKIQTIENRLDLLISATESEKLAFVTKFKMIENTSSIWGKRLYANYFQLSDL